MSVAEFARVDVEQQTKIGRQNKLNLTPQNQMLLYQGGLRAGVPTSNNEFKQLSVFYGHSKEFGV